MAAFARPVLPGCACLVRAAAAFAIVEIVHGLARPRAVVHIDGALTCVARVCWLAGAACAASRTRAAAAATILTCRAVLPAGVALVPVAARVVAFARAELVCGARLIRAANTFGRFLEEVRVTLPGAIV